MATLCRNMNIVMRSRIFHQRGTRTAEAGHYSGTPNEPFFQNYSEITLAIHKLTRNKLSKVHAEFPSQQAQVQHFMAI